MWKPSQDVLHWVVPPIPPWTCTVKYSVLWNWEFIYFIILFSIKIWCWAVHPLKLLQIPGVQVSLKYGTSSRQIGEIPVVCITKTSSRSTGAMTMPAWRGHRMPISSVRSKTCSHLNIFILDQSAKQTMQQQNNEPKLCNYQHGSINRNNIFYGIIRCRMSLKTVK